MDILWAWLISDVFFIITVLFMIFFVIWDKSPFKVWSLVIALLYLVINKIYYELFLKEKDGVDEE
jgi:hypothetical protein